jgi:SAM-dependent methyltransferase
MSAKPDHWNEHARQWSLIGPPLRPVAGDIAVLEREISAWQKRSGATTPRALLCGVTPEIARMRWPGGTRLVAVDHSVAMIAGVWPAGEAPGHAVCGEWMRLPLADGSRDVLIGDGCFSLLVGHRCYAAFAAELRRVAVPGALLLMRYFIRPDTPEAARDVVDDLWQKRIGNFHVFKWRLAMALHGTLDEGVRLADIWNAWHAAAPDPAKLADHLGWPHAMVNTIHNYRGVETRYSFPTLAEARELTGDFDEVAIHVPDYELGERCPTLVMRAR